VYLVPVEAQYVVKNKKSTYFSILVDILKQVHVRLGGLRNFPLETVGRPTGTSFAQKINKQRDVY
jgi:hypothetical protein